MIFREHSACVHPSIASYLVTALLALPPRPATTHAARAGQGCHPTYRPAPDPTPASPEPHQIALEPGVSCSNPPTETLLIRPKILVSVCEAVTAPRPATRSERYTSLEAAGPALVKHPAEGRIWSWVTQQGGAAGQTTSPGQRGRSSGVERPGATWSEP